MIDFILDNLPIIIPVVIVLVVRSIITRKKRAAEDGSQQPEPSWDDEYRDNSSSDEPEAELMHWEIEKKKNPVVQKAKPSRALSSDSPLARKGLQSQTALTSKLEQPVALHAQSAQPEHTSGNVHIPQNVHAADHQASLSEFDHLPLLKKAFVFSEILAPPKALRNEETL